MSILLVRHGETLMNAARTLQVEATPLSPRGLAQVEALAARLRDRHRVAALMSSDLPRAWQTAESIARVCKVPLEAEPLLQERNYGELRGRAYDSLGFDPLVMTEAPPGGESSAAFRCRVARAFDAVVRRAANVRGDLVVVTHGLVIREMLATCLGLGPEQLPPRLSNTGVTSLAAEPPQALECLDDNSHLIGDLVDHPGSLSGG